MIKVLSREVPRFPDRVFARKTAVKVEAMRYQEVTSIKIAQTCRGWKNDHQVEVIAKSPRNQGKKTDLIRPQKLSPQMLAQAFELCKTKARQPNTSAIAAGKSREGRKIHQV
jgi:hypothetical protein